MKISIKKLTQIINEEITKTKIASPTCREELAKQLRDAANNSGGQLTSRERNDIINNFRFNITSQCTWYPFEPLITQNKNFKDEYEVLMSNIGRTGDETEARKVKASLDKLMGIVKKFKRFTAYPGPVEPGYVSDMLELLKGITKKYEKDYLNYYNFDVEDETSPPEKRKLDSIEGEPLVQTQKQPNIQEGLLRYINQNKK